MRRYDWIDRLTFWWLSFRSKFQVLRVWKLYHFPFVTTSHIIIMAEGSSSSTKLTKKQQKAADFKAGKGGAGKKGKKDQARGGEVPEDDLLDETAEVTSPPVAAAESKKSKKSGEEKEAKKSKDKKDKSKKQEAASSTSIAELSSSNKKKRKAADDDEPTDPSEKASTSTAPAKGGKKMAFDEQGNATSIAADSSSSDKAKGKTASDSKANKYIIFVGNMSFKTTSDEISSHFESHCGQKPHSVRLLTTRSDVGSLSASKQKSIAKGKAADTTIRSKGCAFVEFTSASALQKSLNLHHTVFGGRSINVELTAGGGGKSDKRTSRIQEKNTKLEEERKKLHEKYIGPQNEERKKEIEGKRARGEEVGPPRKKVREGGVGEAQWGSRGDSAAAAATSGPGQKGSRRQPKWMASGANAVRIQD